MYYLVYKTTNKLNNKYYIGVHSTKNLNDGYLGCAIWRGRKLREDLKHLPFYRAIEKYGFENFEREILHFCNTSKEAFLLEQKLVDFSDPNCYNLKPGGLGGFAPETNRGRKATQKTKQKLKQAALARNPDGKYLVEWINENLRGKTLEEVYGKEKAEEIKHKKSISMTGYKHGSEAKAKMSESRKGVAKPSRQGRKKVYDSQRNVLKFMKTSEIEELKLAGKVIEKELIISKFQKASYVLV
jgi:group I intron endonuclease